jgi:hypothetical protein
MTAHHLGGHRAPSPNDKHDLGRAEGEATMSELPTTRSPRTPDPEHYRIRVSGHLAARWAEVFDGMTLTRQDDGTTVIHGRVADQAALQGLLRKLGDLGLPLLSVTPAAGGPAACGPATTDPS